MSSSSAKQEWAMMWPLPLTAMLGVAGSSLFAYSSGVFMAPMTAELGWSKVEFSSAFTVMMVTSLFAAPVAGRFVDALGARRVAMFGIVPFAFCFAALGLVGSPVWQWLLLGFVFALFAACIAPTVWITPVVGRFRVSRGLALAVALAGAGLATTMGPPLAAAYIDAFGWRLAFAALALTWVAPMMILTWKFLHDRHENDAPRATRTPDEGGRAATRGVARGDYLKALTSQTFVCLMLAGSLCACISYATLIHLVPMLGQKGIGTAAAAGVVSAAGAAAIVGRLTIGFVLDRLPVRIISICVFLLPLLTAMLLSRAGHDMTTALAAAVILGLANGAEIDIIAYITSRRFPHEMFASVYATGLSIIAVSASTGPLLASEMVERFGSYNPFLLAIVPVSLASAILVALIPPLSSTERDTH